MADTQGIVSGAVDPQGHPSYWNWLMSGPERSTDGSPNGNAHVNGNGAVNGHAFANGNGYANGNGSVNGNGHANGHGSANANGYGHANHEPSLQKLVLEGITPTGLARRLGRR